MCMSAAKLARNVRQKCASATLTVCRRLTTQISSCTHTPTQTHKHTNIYIDATTHICALITVYACMQRLKYQLCAKFKRGRHGVCVTYKCAYYNALDVWQRATIKTRMYAHIHTHTYLVMFVLHTLTAPSGMQFICSEFHAF